MWQVLAADFIEKNKTKIIIGALIVAIVVILWIYVLKPAYNRAKTQSIIAKVNPSNVRGNAPDYLKPLAARYAQATDTFFGGDSLFGDAEIDDVLQEIRAISNDELALLNNIYNQEVSRKYSNESFFTRIQNLTGGWSVNSDLKKELIERLAEIGIYV